jgi:hypothetical protein
MTAAAVCAAREVGVTLGSSQTDKQDVLVTIPTFFAASANTFSARGTLCAGGRLFVPHSKSDASPAPACETDFYGTRYVVDHISHSLTDGAGNVQVGKEVRRRKNG